MKNKYSLKSSFNKKFRKGKPETMSHDENISPDSEAINGISEHSAFTQLNLHLLNDAEYLALNPDVVNYGDSPKSHYENFGHIEGRKVSRYVNLRYIDACVETNELSKLSRDEFISSLSSWSLTSFSPLICPLWISLQLFERPVPKLSLVQLFNKAITVNELSLHPCFRPIPVPNTGLTIFEWLKFLRKEDIAKASILSADTFRHHHRDINKSFTSEFDLLDAFWNSGITESRLHYLGSKKIENASIEKLFLYNVILIYNSELSGRLIKAGQKVETLNYKAFNKDLKISKAMQELFDPAVISGNSFIDLTTLHKIMSCIDREETYVIHRQGNAVAGKKKSNFTIIHDSDLLNGNFKIPTKTVIYSVNFGNYDDYINVPEIDDCSYFLFTDADVLPEDNRWIIVRPTIIERDVKRMCLWYKTHPHRLFNGCEHSIWIDSNIQPLQGFGDLLKPHTETSEVATFKHQHRDCIYKEAEIIKKLKIDHDDRVDQVVKNLKESGMPVGAGLFETNVLYANINDQLVREFFTLWWQHISTGSRRDQLSFTFAAWQKGVHISELDGGNDSKKSKFFTKNTHTSKDGRYLK